MNESLSHVMVREGEGEKAAAYTLLRQLMAEMELPRDALIDYTPKGKPYLSHHPQWHVSISHSGGRVACGMANVPLGVDIEVIRPRKEGLPQRLLSPQEYQWFCGRGSQWGDFYSLWVLKESLLKCQGTGINRPMHTVSVPLLDLGQCAQWEGYSFQLEGSPVYRRGICIQA